MEYDNSISVPLLKFTAGFTMFMRVQLFIYSMLLVFVYRAAHNESYIRRMFEFEVPPKFTSLVFALPLFFPLAKFLSKCLNVLKRNTPNFHSPEQRTGVFPEENSIDKSKKPREQRSFKDLPIIRHFSETGIFGVFGDFFEERVMVMKWLGLLVQIYQAQQFSRTITTRVYVYIHSIVLFLDFTFGPWLLFSQRGSSKGRRLIMLCAELVVDFIFAILMPLILVVYPIVGLVNNFHELVTDDAWITTAYLNGDQFIIQSVSDLVGQVFPLIVMEFTLWDTKSILNSLKKVKAINMRNYDHRRTENFNMLSMNGLSKKSLRFGSIVAAVVATCVSVIHLSSAYISTCDIPCETQIFPCFTTKCHCPFISINCAVQNGARTSDAFSAEDYVSTILHKVEPKSVLTVLITRCPIEKIPPVIEEFHSLWNFLLHDTNLREYNINSKENHPKLMTLSIDESYLSEIPRSLYDPPPSLLYFRLNYCGIYSLPEYEDLNWDSVMYFSLVGNELHEFPHTILKAQHVIGVSLGNNPISSIPSSITNLENLQNLYLFGLNITEIPEGLFYLPNLRLLDLSGTNVQSLPDSVSVELLHSNSFDLSLGGSPVCRDQSSLFHQTKEDAALFCKEPCSRSCPLDTQTDGRCQSYCLSESCNWDGICGKKHYPDIMEVVGT